MCKESPIKEGHLSEFPRREGCCVNVNSRRRWQRQRAIIYRGAVASKSETRGQIKEHQRRSSSVCPEGSTSSQSTKTDEQRLLKILAACVFAGLSNRRRDAEWPSKRDEQLSRGFLDDGRLKTANFCAIVNRPVDAYQCNRKLKGTCSGSGLRCWSVGSRRCQHSCVNCKLKWNSIAFNNCDLNCNIYWRIVNLEWNWAGVVCQATGFLIKLVMVYINAAGL